MTPPSEWAEEREAQEGGAAGAASAVPWNVAVEMRAFIAAVTMPETELQQQLLDAAKQWAARNDVPRGAALSAAWAGGAAAAAMPSHCLVGSSLNNSRCSSPGWSSASDMVLAGGGAAASGRAAGGSGPGSSGRSSEEGSSTAWRLCTWLQRQGWPAQHCASFRCAGSGGSASGWRSTSGHEFVILYPHRCLRQHLQQQHPGAATAAAALNNAVGSSASRNSVDGDVDMGAGGGAAAAPLVIDPEFSTQFALASPSPRYQLVVSLLPRVFVGTYDRLHQLVEWACCEMQGSFQGSGSGLPPWRSLDQVLNKWRLMGNDDEAGSPGVGSGVDDASRVHARAPPGWGAQPLQEQQPAATAAVAAANGEHAACGAAASPAPVPADCGSAIEGLSEPVMAMEGGFPKGLQVLVVDDAGEQGLAGLALRAPELKYCVTSVSSLAEAAACFAGGAAAYDCVVAEWGLLAAAPPSEAAAFFHGAASLHAPVVLMGAAPSPDELMQGLRWGACDFLERPLSMLKLKTLWQHKIRKMMQRGNGGVLPRRPSGPQLPAPSGSEGAVSGGAAKSVPRSGSMPGFSCPATPSLHTGILAPQSSASLGSSDSACRATACDGQAGGATDRSDATSGMPRAAAAAGHAAPLACVRLGASGEALPAVVHWPALPQGTTWGTPLGCGVPPPPLPGAAPAAPQQPPAFPLPSIRLCPPGSLPLPATTYDVLLPKDFSIARVAQEARDSGSGTSPGPLGLRLTVTPELLAGINASLAAHRRQPCSGGAAAVATAI
ncbi:DNA helicase II ATP-dependent DNA helicase [Micractinium conductrix]|uniref:DNA helicase II ATP-dependent DNA helicase n=1 Tax=Micractinium conductrix TaxID=554055 RepID=A0A2P6V6X4_9CHLO|nr:DNA helicase II ATP-dependent DNA helicase [Micractinium conductrix]|eukprot:PSC69837.1 DNA helicase II ATP-dependent DNA helicase [Micractinium conductrix]